MPVSVIYRRFVLISLAMDIYITRDMDISLEI